MNHTNMRKQKEFKFHVIELLEPPCTYPEKYVCVPNSWIRLRETSDGVALFKFPVDGLSEIKKRAKKQELSENWIFVLADIKHSTNTYTDASNYIKILNKISDQDQSSMKIVEGVPSTSYKKILESQSSSETNKVCITSALNSDAAPVSKEIPNQPDLTDAEVRISRKKSKVGTADVSTKARRYLTRQSLKMSLSDNNTVSLPDQTTKDNLPETNHCVEESDKTNNNQENEPSAKNSLELTRKLQIIKGLRLVFGDNFKETLEQLHNEFEKNHLLLEKMRPAFMTNCKIIKEFIELTNEESTRKQQFILALRLVFGDNFKETLEQLHNKFEKNHLVLEKMRPAFMTNCKIIKEVIKLTDEVNNGPDISDLNFAVKELENNMMKLNTNENNSVKATGSKVQNDTRKKKEKQHNSDGTEVKNNNPLSKIRGQARKFTLPPEYDPDDSRWTLKHREMKSGLVELLTFSQVYVDAFQLSNIKITSKDSKTLARKLALEIFTENALSICSLTGQKANAFDFEGTSVRPGLDDHARTVLLNYVKKHAAEQNWSECNSELVWNTIRNKMQEMRGKHQNIVENN